ncbi:rhodanese-like domain-containing protein [Flavobacteriaceae bacterium PRS1]|jgi:rhodanese-related sulfurtransferase|nr:rhodanese-like domain-containing protein [Flavobacteriaceae bacterium PRS1]
MKKILILMFSLSSLLGCKSESKAMVQIVSVAEFKEGLSNNEVQLIDVRTPKEYNDGHIENARLIDFLSEDFKIKIQELDKEKPIYLYCRSGGRSGKASKVMEEFGFKEIVDLEGGYMAWSKK